MTSTFKSYLTKLPYVLLLMGAVFFAVNSIRETLPPSKVVIETGPVGGSYHDNALRYAKKLEAAGFKIEVRPNPQSLETIDHIESGKPHVDIGFTIQPLDRSKYPNTRSAGVIEIQPLFIFYNVEKGLISKVNQLIGKRVVMPTEKSVTSASARSLLALYGVTAENTTFTYMPIAEAAIELKNGQHDAGFFMLAPSNKIVKDLAESKNLALLSLTGAQGISRQLDYLKPATLHRGAYDLLGELPATDISMLGGTVNVMVREDINPVLLYSLLEVMMELHQGQTLLSSRGEFPTIVGTTLEAHPLAVQWHKVGTPWVFKNFGATLASLLDKYWLVVAVLIVISQAYTVSHDLYRLVHLGSSSVALRILLRLQKRLNDGKTPGAVSKGFYRAAKGMTAASKNQNEKAQAMLEQLKTKMT